MNKLKRATAVVALSVAIVGVGSPAQAAKTWAAGDSCGDYCGTDFIRPGVWERFVDHIEHAAGWWADLLG